MSYIGHYVYCGSAAAIFGLHSISMGLGVQAYSLFAGEMSLNLNSLSERMAAIPRGGPALLVFIAGSLLYLAGIFRLGRATNPSREKP